MPKATTQWPACVVDSSLIDPDSSALTIKPLSLHETSKSQQIITNNIINGETLFPKGDQGPRKLVKNISSSVRFSFSVSQGSCAWSLETDQSEPGSVRLLWLVSFEWIIFFLFFMKCSVTVDLRNVFFTQCLKLSFCKRVSVVKHYLRSHMAHSSQA